MPAADFIRHQLLFAILLRDNEVVSNQQLERFLFQLAKDSELSLRHWLEREGDFSTEELDRFEKLVAQRLLAGKDKGFQSLEGLSSIDTVAFEVQASIARIKEDKRELPTTDNLTVAWDSLQQDIQTHRLERSKNGNRFRILRAHAKGGLGIVYVAEDQELGREVAVKHIQEQFLRNENLRQKFVFEAEVTGQLEHPSIVPVYALGVEPNGQPFYAMRLIRGEDLKSRIKSLHDSTQTPRSRFLYELRSLLRRFIDVCNAVGYAHQRGVLHRDLKPGNIMLGKHGETFVVDWGLAKTQTAISSKVAGDNFNTEVRPQSGSGLAETGYGSILGTPAYAPPEQLSGQLDRLDARSDIYALGSMLYELLTGGPPITKAKSIAEVLQQIEKGIPNAKTVNLLVPSPLAAITAKALQYSKEERYTSVDLLRKDIESYLDDQPVSALREGLVDRLGRLLRRHRGIAVTVVVSSLLVATVAAVGAVAYRSIATVANESNEKNKQMLREASRSEFNLANRLIAESYQTSDESERGSRQGYKSNWHFGVAHLIQAIRLDPDNQVAKRRLYETLVFQGKKRRDTPLHIENLDGLTHLRVSPTGKLMITVDASSKARFWDLTKSPLSSRTVDIPQRILVSRFARNDELWIAHYANKIQVWDTSAVKKIGEFDRVNVWGEKSWLFWSTHADKNSIILRSTPFDENSIISQYNPFDKNSQFVRVGLDGQKLPLANIESLPGDLMDWDPETGLEVWRENETLTWIDRSQGKVLHRQSNPYYFHRNVLQDQPYAFKDRGDRIGRASYNFRHKRFVFAIDDTFSTISHDDQFQFKESKLFSTPNAYGQNVMLSPDGGKAVAKWVDKGLEFVLFGANGLVLRRTVMAEGSPSLGATVNFAFSPDGSRCAGWGNDILMLWDVHSGKLIREPIRLENGMNRVRFCAEGRNILTYGSKQFAIWNAAAEQTPELTLPTPFPVFGFSEVDNEHVKVHSSSLKPFYRLTQSFHDLFDLKTLKKTSQLAAVSVDYKGMGKVSPDGSFIACSSLDKGTTTVFDLQGRKRASVPGSFEFEWTADSRSLIVREHSKGKLYGDIGLQLKSTIRVLNIQSNTVWDSSSVHGKETSTTWTDKHVFILVNGENNTPTTLFVYPLDNLKQSMSIWKVGGFEKVFKLQSVGPESLVVWELEKYQNTTSLPNEVVKLTKINWRNQSIQGAAIEIAGKAMHSIIYDPAAINSVIRSEPSKHDFLVVCGTSFFLNVTDWRLIPIQPLQAGQFLNNPSASERLGLVVANSSQSEYSPPAVWSLDTGKKIGEYNANGRASVSERGEGALFLGDSQKLVRILDPLLDSEIGEPYLLDETQEFFGAISRNGRNLFIASPKGLRVRPLIMEQSLKDCENIGLDEIAWIENWIGLKPDQQLGFKTIPRVTSVNDSKSLSGVWSSLRTWLEDSSPQSKLSPDSPWTVEQASRLYANASPANAAELLTKWNPDIPNATLLAAKYYREIGKNDEDFWAKMIADHLRERGRRQATSYSALDRLRAAELLAEYPEGNMPDAFRPELLKDAMDTIESLTTEQVDWTDDHVEALLRIVNAASPFRNEPLDQAQRKRLTDLIAHFLSVESGRVSASSERRIQNVQSLRNAREFLLLNRFFLAIARQDWGQCREELKAFETPSSEKLSEDTKRLCKELVARMESQPVRSKHPDEISDVDHIELSRCVSSVEKVGFGTPLFDRYPSPCPVLIVDYRPYISGIYAHAPAEHQYRLGKKWKRFQGRVGLQDSGNGSAMFEIWGDGKKLWQSGTIFARSTSQFDLDVSEIQTIQLIVTDNGDGRNSDWGLWLEPTLYRTTTTK